MKKLKVVQLAVYNTNIGDTIAIKAIRNRFEKYCDQPVEWIDLDLLKNFYRDGNDPKKARKKLEQFTKNANLLIVGGCGLIEGAGWNRMKTGWKLPFSAETVGSIKCPVVTFGVGANFFRGMPTLTEKGSEALQVFINHCKYFSVRNDGSFEVLNEMGFTGIEEVPDGGLIYPQERVVKDKEQIKTMIFNPTFNNNAKINEFRKIDNSVKKGVMDKMKEKGIRYFAHTPKSYTGWKGHYLFGSNVLMSGVKTENVDKYIDDNYGKAFDAITTMHGHGQLIAFGKNVPFITFATQDKNVGFNRKYGLLDYQVDTQEDNWSIKLFEKMDRLQNDSEYLKTWYETRHSHYDKMVDTFDDLIKRSIETANESI